MNIHTGARKSLIRFTAITMLAIVVLQSLVFTSFAAAIQTTPGGGGGGTAGSAKIDAMALPDQIRTYKMYYALGVCVKSHVLSDTPTGAVAAPGPSVDHVNSGDLFKDDVVDVGSLVDIGGNDGEVHCNDILTQANGLWGISSYPAFLKSAGWNYYKQHCTVNNRNTGMDCSYQSCTPSAGTQCDGMEPPSSGADTKFKAAIAKLLGGEPLYPDYFDYYDNWKTYTGICGAKPVSDSEKAAGGYTTIYYANPSSGKVSAEAYTTVYKSVHFGAAYGLISAYGDAVNPSGYKYNGKTVSCSDVAKQLSKANAQNYLAALKNAPKGITGTDPKDNSNNPGGNSSDNGTSCNIQGIGWIICPVMTFLGKLNDTAFGVLNNFLEVKSNLTTGSDLVQSWSTFRNIANILFVIAFLIVIYSQITGTGVSNYGIKKLLPRIIAVAILVNISLILCQIAVDLSNVIGGSIYDLFKGVPVAMGHESSGMKTWSDVISTLLIAGVGVGLLVVVILAPMALLAVAVALLMLIARQALIVILIVIAPLAFVAYLLPNTASLFKKWWKIFSSLLLLYPIIGVIFGGSTLAAKIIAGTQGSSGTDKWIYPLMALGAMSLPLFLVPTTLKNAFSSLGSLGGKLAAIQSGANKRSMNTIKQSRIGEMKEARDRRKAASRVQRRLGNGGMLSKVGLKKLDYTRLNPKIDNARIPLGGGRSFALGEAIGGNRGRSRALSEEFKRFDEDVSAEKTTMTSMGGDELSAIMKDEKASEVRRAAAASRLMQVGSGDHINDAINYLGANKGKDGISSIQKQVAADIGNRKPVSMGAGSFSDLQTGTFGGNMNDMIKARIESGKYTPESLASASPEELSAIENYIVANRTTLRSNVNTSRFMDELKQNVYDFRNSPNKKGSQPAPEAARKIDDIMNNL